jgi:hypothetical protein
MGAGTIKAKSPGKRFPQAFPARRTRLELAVSGVTGRRYNQLNYRRIHLRASPFGTGLVAWGVRAVKANLHLSFALGNVPSRGALKLGVAC